VAQLVTTRQAKEALAKRCQDPKLKLGENEGLQFQTASFAVLMISRD